MGCHPKPIDEIVFFKMVKLHHQAVIFIQIPPMPMIPSLGYHFAPPKWPGNTLDPKHFEIRGLWMWERTVWTTNATEVFEKSLLFELQSLPIKWINMVLYHVLSHNSINSFKLLLHTFLGYLEGLGKYDSSSQVHLVRMQVSAHANLETIGRNVQRRKSNRKFIQFIQTHASWFLVLWNHGIWIDFPYELGMECHHPNWLHHFSEG